MNQQTASNHQQTGENRQAGQMDGQAGIVFDGKLSFTDADDALRGVLDAAGPAIAGASPCPGWSGIDVLDHLVQSERAFAERFGQDLGPAPAATEPIAIWSAHADAMRTLIERPGVAEIPYPTPWGDSTVGAMLANFYGFDLIVHRWDVARAAGHDTRFTEAELDGLEATIAQLGDLMYGPGAFAGGVTAPAGADRQTRVLAVLGRTT
jgi:uncharacterized protein (TIGR03086 family)